MQVCGIPAGNKHTTSRQTAEDTGDSFGAVFRCQMFVVTHYGLHVALCPEDIISSSIEQCGIWVAMVVLRGCFVCCQWPVQRRVLVAAMERA